MFTAIQLRKELNMTCNYTDNASATTVQNVSGKAFQGEIWLADLGEKTGSIEYGIRPVLIIQNNIGNRHSPTIICAAITSKMNKAKLPTHIEICTNDYNIMKNSVILLEQIRTIDKKRLREYVCHIDQERMKKIDQAIRISLDLTT